MRVVGLDLSLRASGYAIYDTAWRKPYVDVIETEAEPHAVGLGWTRKRLRYITDGLLADILGGDARHPERIDLAVFEQPAYSSGAGHQHDRSGLQWFVLDGLIGAGVPCLEIGSGTLKLYATDNGRAEKTEVVRAISLNFPGVDIPDDNAADALALCAMGARHLGHPIEAYTGPLSRKQQKSWDAIKWPERTTSR